jgi:hypothetical protein
VRRLDAAFDGAVRRAAEFSTNPLYSALNKLWPQKGSEDAKNEQAIC